GWAHQLLRERGGLEGFLPVAAVGLKCHAVWDLPRHKRPIALPGLIILLHCLPGARAPGYPLSPFQPTVRVNGRGESNPRHGGRIGRGGTARPRARTTQPLAW